jgi:hypothetical protein
MPFITLYGDHENRIGSHLIIHICEILYAHKNKYYIKYDINKIRYKSSVFLKVLLNYIDNYNDTFIEKDEIEYFPFSNDNFKQMDWTKTIYKSIQCIKIDFKSYWREINPNFYNDLLQLSSYKELPFNPKKTIAVHLRLDDVHDWWDYDGTASANHYRDIINNNTNIDEVYHIHNYASLPNMQAPIAMERIECQIQDAKMRFPDHEVVIISSPCTKHLIRTNHRIICNDDESYDLFLLSVSNVVILSRSNFSTAVIIFGNHERIYAPLWGQLVINGFYTKYHENSSIFSFFH